MNASSRIKLIKEISKELGKEEWSIIDLTLDQLNFQTVETFSGNSFEYVLQQVQNSTDEKILDLANHLNIGIESNQSTLTPSFWRDGYFNLFISHLASNKTIAQELKNELEKYGISGFVAHSDIEPTKEWQDEIELALRTSDALVALMIPKFHESNWTDQEIGLALGRDLLIIPVRMGQDPYGFIGKFQAIPFSDTIQLATTIFDSLLKNKKTIKKMSQSIIYRFATSDSFLSAKKNILLVEKIETWDKQLIDSLESARQNNYQISSSFGVPERVNRIIDDFENSK